jgi:hypothetical protein
MNLYQWLCLLGIPSIVTILIGILIKKPIERRIAAQERQQTTQQTQTQAVMLGVQALLRDRLLQGYKFYEEQGWASYEDKTNMENMHTQYEALGENNVMNARHQRFIALPDNPPDRNEGGTNA